MISREQSKREDEEAVQALPKLEERTAQLLKAAGIEDTKVISDHSELSEPFIEFDGTGIGIYVTHYDRAAILNIAAKISGTTRELGYQVYSTSYDPGVMYHPDGSGTPPSTDIEDADDITEHLDDAIVSAIVIMVRERISQHIDREMEKAVEDEEEHYERLAEELAGE